MFFRIRKKIICFLLIAVFSLSLPARAFMLPDRVQATAGIASIASYILSTIGALNVGTNGGVGRVSGSLYDSIKQKVADAMGSGVYVDSNGNYVFSSEFTQSIYEALSGSSSYDVRVISNFSNSDEERINTSYFSPAFNSNIASMRAAYDVYLLQLQQSINNNNQYLSVATCYDLSGVVGISRSGKGFIFLDKDLNQKSCKLRFCTCVYDPNKSSFSNSNVNANWNLHYLACRGNAGDNYGAMDIGGSFSQDGYENFYDYMFLKFPVFHGTLKNASAEIPAGAVVNFDYYSNRSILLAMNSAAVNSSLNQSSGVFYNNLANIPSVSETVINNNNWDNIYNDYVTNVSNKYTEEHSGEDFDQDLLRKWMRQYSNNIIKSIENGFEDIESQVRTSNNWLEMIYTRIGEIEDMLSDGVGGSGGGSGAWTSEDIDTLLERVASIYTIENSSNQELGRIYVLLGQLLSAVQNRRWSPSAPLIDDWSYPDILDTISAMDVIKEALANSVPFCYLGVAVALVTGLSEEPQVIDADIPFKFTSSNVSEFSVDENIEVDLSPFSDVRDILVALQVIAFIIFLIWLTFRLLDVLTNLMG